MTKGMGSLFAQKIKATFQNSFKRNKETMWPPFTNKQVICFRTWDN